MVGEVEEEGVVFAAAHELQRLAGAIGGERIHIGLGLDGAHDFAGLAHEGHDGTGLDVAGGSIESGSEVAVLKALCDGIAARAHAEMPFADDAGAIASIA